ncbi:DUF4286 family protein [Sphingomonas sp. SRS2]|uniref:DUF4286 family protein n=1 Tax=Sphingomonas sp. SRS2 TaxID=133190 RepID=UPI00061844E6|nr:DUF4286 family protein [Sphingomonas sp. SRS2]KKC26182.1 hypothetical protein WP12_09850 [Sphingomonas sp. SRS2]
MKKYKLIVLSNAADEMHDEFKRWYKDQHLGDVLRVPGFVGAQRFDAVLDVEPQTPYRYLAVYDIETDDLAATIQGLKDRSDTAEMPISPALDLDNIFVVPFEASTEHRTAGQA